MSCGAWSHMFSHHLEWTVDKTIVCVVACITRMARHCGATPVKAKNIWIAKRKKDLVFLKSLSLCAYYTVYDKLNVHIPSALHRVRNPQWDHIKSQSACSHWAKLKEEIGSRSAHPTMNRIWNLKAKQKSNCELKHRCVTENPISKWKSNTYWQDRNWIMMMSRGSHDRLTQCLLWVTKPRGFDRIKICESNRS